MNARVLTCTCNGTVDVDGKALGRTLQAAGVSADVVMSGTQLCRRQLPEAAKLLQGVDDIVVTCTQERALFDEAAHQAVAPIRFVNVREQAGWGSEGAQARPKIAALVAMAVRDVRDPVPAVSYESSGRMLLIGHAAALDWAQRLAALPDTPLAVSVLMPSDEPAAGARLAAVRDFPVFSGVVEQVAGWLGRFDVRWRQSNPIDLEACVRCGACVSACPEGAIDQSLQVDTDRCRSHRACVAACGDVAAIDFSRRETGREAQFDLVIDFRAKPAFTHHQLPQGYWHCGTDPARQAEAVLAASAMVGEFEKPKFFNYRQDVCAHERNRIVGCSRCIDVCSARAIAPAGDGIRVEPHLCVGCGACASTCPSGAMTYAYPTAESVGRRLKAALGVYRAAGGKRPVLLLHGEDAAAGILAGLGRGAGASVSRAPRMRGLPARVIPVPQHHVASVGADVALAAIAYGAAQVVWWFTGAEAPEYRAMMEEQVGWAGALLAGLGLDGRRLVVLEASDPLELEERLARLETPEAIGEPATFAVSTDKRRTIEFAVDHLLKVLAAGANQSAAAHDAGANRVIPLPAASPFGRIRVNHETCTLCLSCVGSCPEKALLDMGDEPGLRLIERNCVQCGLCEQTCPESAITLEPRYLAGPQRGEAVTLNRAKPLACIRCGKLFGTQQMIDAVKRKLTGHRMFGEAGMKSLEMCADCRVTELFTSPKEVSVFDIKRDGP